MKIGELLRTALPPARGASALSTARKADEKRATEAAKAWERRGGPVDAGFVA